MQRTAARGEFQAGLERSADSPEGRFAVGVRRFAIGQVRELVDGGVPGLHFYVLDRFSATSAVLRDVRPPRPNA